MDSIWMQTAHLPSFEPPRGCLHANLEAVAAYRALCRNIDCGFEEQDAFVYARDSRKELDREVTALHSLGYGASFVSETPLPFPVAGAVRFQGQAQFHPVKFAAAISHGLRIYEHTRVQQLAPGRAVSIPSLAYSRPTGAACTRSSSSTPPKPPSAC